MKNVTNKITSERIKELREEKGMTQEDLAQKIFVSREALANFETRRGIPEDKLKDIAKEFETTVDYLLGETNVRSKDNEEYQLIGKRTGLNDKVIEILSDLKLYNPEVIHTINYLIEQEEIFPLNSFDVSIPENATKEEENKIIEKAEENFLKAEEYWNSVHFPILSKISGFYNLDMPKESLYITAMGIKRKNEFKNKIEMQRKVKAEISAENLSSKAMLDEINYQLSKSKENKSSRAEQKKQNKKIQEFAKKQNSFLNLSKNNKKKDVE